MISKNHVPLPKAVIKAVIEKHIGREIKTTFTRKQSVVFPLQVYAYCLHTYSAMTLDQIAQEVNRKDHTTVLYSIHKIANETRIYDNVRDIVLAVECVLEPMVKPKPFVSKDYGDIERDLSHCEPQVCKHFGCGMMLTPEEKLFGDRCIQHRMKQNPIDEYLKNKNEKLNTHTDLPVIDPVVQKRSKRRA